MDLIASISLIFLAYISYRWLGYKNDVQTKLTQQYDATAEKSRKEKVGEYRMAAYGGTLLRSSQVLSSRPPLEVLYPGPDPDDPNKVDIEYVPADLLGYVNLIA